MIAALLWVGSAGVARAETPGPALAVGEVAVGEVAVGEVAAAPEAGETVLATFVDLAAAYRRRLPGPRGEMILQQRLDRLLTRTFDVETFARTVLGAAWDGANAGDRARWRDTFSLVLRARHARWLKAPHRLDVRLVQSIERGNRAQVTIAIFSKDDRSFHEATMDLTFGGGAWRVFNVTLEGVSLARAWGSRFERQYAAGGLAAVDKRMRSLHARYDGHHPDGVYR